MGRKLNKNLKMRSAAKQPICGLWAAARCCGIRLNSAKKIQEFRDMLLTNKVISRGGNWVGGTTDAERMQICAFLGCSVTDVFKDLIQKRGIGKTITVKSLLTSREFFQTRRQYMLLVDQHVVYVRTNKMKRKLWVADQRGKPMRVARKNQTIADKELSTMLNKHVVSVWAVDHNSCV